MIWSLGITATAAMAREAGTGSDKQGTQLSLKKYDAGTRRLQRLQDGAELRFNLGGFRSREYVTALEHFVLRAIIRAADEQTVLRRDRVPYGSGDMKRHTIF